MGFQKFGVILINVTMFLKILPLFCNLTIVKNERNTVNVLENNRAVSGFYNMGKANEKTNQILTIWQSFKVHNDIRSHRETQRQTD